MAGPVILYAGSSYDRDTTPGEQTTSYEFAILRHYNWDPDDGLGGLSYSLLVDIVGTALLWQATSDPWDWPGSLKFINSSQVEFYSDFGHIPFYIFENNSAGYFSSTAELEMNAFDLSDNAALYINSSIVFSGEPVFFRLHGDARIALGSPGSFGIGALSLTLYDDGRVEGSNIDQLGYPGSLHTISFNESCVSASIGFHNGFNDVTAQSFIDDNFLVPSEYTYRLTSSHSGWVALVSNVDAVIADSDWFPCEAGYGDSPLPVSPFTIYETGKFGVSSVTDYNNSVVASINFDASCTAAAIGFYAGFSPEIGDTLSAEWTGGPFTTIMETEDTGWIAPTSNVEAVQSDDTWFPECKSGVNMADITYDDISTLLRVEIDDVDGTIWGPDLEDPDKGTLELLFDSFMEGINARNPVISALNIPVDTRWKQAAIYFIAMRCFSSQVEGGHSQKKMENYAALYENEVTLHGFIR